MDNQTTDDPILALKARREEIEARLAAACLRAGRDPREVRLVAVTKTQPVEVLRAGLAAGLTILGENYIQEAQAKIEALAGDSGATAASWHFIGRLQTNKAKYAARLFDVIHSVDNIKLAGELDRKAEAAGRRIGILIQVNMAGEETKGGVTPAEVPELVDHLAKLTHVQLRGLMTMPPFFDQPERVRPYFAGLRSLREQIGPPLVELSMGMSGDFEVAVEEGATLVRVGTALFGARG